MGLDLEGTNIGVGDRLVSLSQASSSRFLYSRDTPRLHSPRHVLTDFLGSLSRQASDPQSLGVMAILPWPVCHVPLLHYTVVLV